MKIKLVVVALISLLLVACGKSEEEKRKEAALAQLADMQIEKNQKQAAANALNALASLKAPTAEYFSKNMKCASDNLDITKVIADKYADTLESLSIKDIPNGCQLKATFKESTLIPDMSKESMILTMSIGSDAFYWKCEFTGKNKRDVPKSCQ